MTAFAGATVTDWLTQDQHDYGMARGHSPVAEKVAAIDFDGTLVEWGALMGEKNLEPGALDAVNALKAAGYTIVIFTSRLSQTWAEHVTGSKNKYVIERFLREQHDYVSTILTQAGVPFDRITAEKVPAEFYIDDKAYRYDGDWQTTTATAVANAKGGLCFVHWAQRGLRVHRIAEVEFQRRFDAPANITGYRTSHYYKPGTEPVGWTPSPTTRFVIRWMCGRDVQEYGFNNESEADLMKRLVDSGEVIKDFRQPTCFQCSRSNKEPYTGERQ